jgi:2-C-methyl-D-erythritol 4-phosphate cytidylyltransferase / 2-C-methyl-D-erythritol 2,4-cyclodiphosphate synthase
MCHRFCLKIRQRHKQKVGLTQPLSLVDELWQSASIFSRQKSAKVSLLDPSTPNSRKVALIVAGGRGLRTGGAQPKQFAPLAGVSLIARAVDAFAEMDAVHVVVGEGQEKQLSNALAGRSVANVSVGGGERIDSVRAGLEAIAANGGADIVLIHDAARPLLPGTVIERLIAALEVADGAVPVLALVDTLALKSNEGLGDVVDRAALVRVQTPQAFRWDAIMTSHQIWSGGPATDDAQMARAAGFSVVMVEGDTMLEKITHAEDFMLAEARIGQGLVSRIGMGFDVHRFEAGRPLWLCGVEIPHSAGLEGHSDADVALHAVVDALLGAIAAGDIGDHFPPTGARWKGAASWQFLDYTRDLVHSRGAIIDHVDLTIICEAPKIGPYRSAMRARLADILQIDEGQISVKATTTEKLGFTGRGEGIAAQAVATVRSK